LKPTGPKATSANMSTEEEMELYFNITIGIEDDDLIIALIEQGFSTMANINTLELDDITRICNIIRKPGGMIIDENGVIVPNRGQPLLAPDEARLKQFWYFLRYAYMTQRIPDFETGDGVPELEDRARLNVFCKNFLLAKDVDKPPQWPGIEKAPCWFEQFQVKK
jgi:hypothetical protein